LDSKHIFIITLLYWIYLCKCKRVVYKLDFYRKKNKNKGKTIVDKINKGLEQEEKIKEHFVPPTKAELAFMKQQEKLVTVTCYFTLYCK